MPSKPWANLGQKQLFAQNDPRTRSRRKAVGTIHVRLDLLVSTAPLVRWRGARTEVWWHWIGVGLGIVLADSHITPCHCT